MNVTKLGAFKIHELLLDIDNDGSKDGRCTLKGFLSKIYNLKLGRMYRRGFPCRLFPGSQLGVYNETNGSYTGLLGRVQRGELYTIVMPVMYPMADPSGEMFSYTPALMEDTMTIFSVYNTTTETHVGDVFSMFSSVPTSLWIGFVLTFFALALVSSIGGRLVRKSHSGFWMSLCTLLEQDMHHDYFPTGARHFAVLSSSVMVGFFFIIQYRGGCISTDLVTIDKPIVIKTYDDIIERRVIAGFSQQTPEWGKFAAAPRGSKERKIFERSGPVSFGGNFEASLRELVDQKKCVIGRPFIATLAALAHLALPSFPDECACFVGADPQAKKYTMVFVINPRQKDSAFAKYEHVWARRISAHGFTQYAMERTIIQIIEAVFGMNAMAPSKQNKVTSHIEEKSGDIIDISLRMYKRAAFLSFLLIGVAFLVLVAEIFWFASSSALKPKGMRRRVRTFSTHVTHAQNWDYVIRSNNPRYYNWNK